MDIETSGAVNLFFPNSSLTLVYFEAIANALDAEASKIAIHINITSFDKPDTLIITISDNGTGFNNENFDRFKTLLKPRDKHHKGIGRLIYLKYFKKVSIKSEWLGYSREFIFKEGFDGNAPAILSQEKSANRTSLVFSSFANDKVKSYDHLKPESLKPMIIEQFLPTLFEKKRDGKKFEISIKLVTGDSNSQKEFFNHQVKITENDLPSLTKQRIEDPTIDALSSIDMLYHIEETIGKSSCLIAFNIDGRTIPVNLISQSSIPTGYNLVCLFESEIFHSNADSSRQKLILPDGLPENILFKRLKQELGKLLAEFIPQIKAQNIKTKAKFEKQFPHLLGYFETENIGLIDKDEALSIAQQKFFVAEKEILQSEDLTDEAYEKSLELSSRVLTEYVLYREKIIRRMKSMTAANAETEIHNLIVPRYQEFTGLNHSEVYQNNAWLLDDKFMVFRTVLSEKRMDEVIQAISLDEDIVGDDGRPDIAMIFSADPDNSTPVDVVIVEIKKKTENEKDNLYAITQLLQRAEKLVKHCSNIQRVWYYAVMEVNEGLTTRLMQQKWAPLYSKGQVFYQDYVTYDSNQRAIPTPTFVMSFDAIVNDAQTRNHTFLDILREGMKKYAN
jgi:hypothetical protein